MNYNLEKLIIYTKITNILVMISNEYLAGLFDGDGSFSCQLQVRDVERRKFQIYPRCGISFKQEIPETKLLHDIQKQLQLGKIYIANDGKETGKVTLYTTNVVDTNKLCNYVFPYLHIRKEQCKQLLYITEVMLSKVKDRYCKGPLTTNCDIYVKEELIKIVTIATTMNSRKQIQKQRNTLGRNTQYYLDLIDRMYDINMV